MSEHLFGVDALTPTRTTATARRSVTANPKALGDLEVGRIATVRAIVRGLVGGGVMIRLVAPDGRESEPLIVAMDWPIEGAER